MVDYYIEAMQNIYTIYAIIIFRSQKQIKLWFFSLKFFNGHLLRFRHGHQYYFLTIIQETISLKYTTDECNCMTTLENSITARIKLQRRLRVM